MADVDHPKLSFVFTVVVVYRNIRKQQGFKL